MVYNAAEIKSQQEKLIDDLMINEVALAEDGSNTINLKILNGLKNASPEKRRTGILSILDKDRRLFCKIHKDVTETYVNKYDHINNIVEMVREYVKVGDVEKKLYGEVMTPISLVNEMLDMLPSDVWNNPNLKWLDPCNGVGVFPCVIVKRLMEGLVDFEPNVELRYKHIIENMLYVCELQPKNMFLFMFCFDTKDEYDLNIYNGSYLDEKFDKYCMDVWGIEKFDIIVGNPPYQEQKEGNKKTQPLWHLFVQKSISLLNDNSYLCMVHPSGWRNVDGVFKKTQELIKNYDLLKLNINTFQDGMKTFGVGTNYDFYCLRKSNNPELLTEIIDSDNCLNEINIKNWEFLPNGDFNFIQSLLADKENAKVLYERSMYGTDKINMSLEKNDEFNLPCVYTITQKNGIKVWYSSQNKGHFGVSKLIWTNGLGTYPIVDMNGEYGLTQFSYAIVDKTENLEKIKNAMEHDRFLKMCEYIKFTNNKYDYKIIGLFKKDFWKSFI